MRTKTVATLVIVLTLCIVAQTFIIFRQQRTIATMRSKLLNAPSEAYEWKNELDKTNRYRLLEYATEQRTVGNQAAQHTDGTLHYLADIVQQPTLVFHFTERCCIECVDSNLAIVNQLHSIFPPGSIIVLSSYDKLNKLILKKRNHNVNAECYNLIDPMNILQDSTDEAHDKPFFALIDHQHRVCFPRITGVGDSINNPYFARVAEYIHATR